MGGTVRSAAAWVLASSLAVAAVGACASGTTKDSAVADYSAAAALAAIFETVMISDSSVVGDGSADQAPAAVAARSLSLPLMPVNIIVAPLGARFAQELWNGSTRVLIGAADFRAPHGTSLLGDVQSRFTYVIVLKSETERLEQAAADVAHKQSNEAHWSWSVPGTEGHPELYRFFSTILKGRYLIISDNTRDLTSLTSALARFAPAPVPLPFDGDTVSSSVVLGFRNYRHQDVDKAASGTTDISSDTRALTVRLARSSTTAEVTLMASSSNTVERLNSRHLFPAFTENGMNGWHARIVLDGTETSTQQVLALLSLFGFGIYV